MQTLKENVILKLRESPDHPLKIKEIARRLEVGDDSLRDLKAALKELTESGELVQTRGKRFGLPEHMNLVVGVLIGHPDGYGFVQPLPRPGQINLPDVYVRGRNVNSAMHGDKVIVRLTDAIRPRRPRRGQPVTQRLQGEIIRVLERAHRTIVGVYEEGRNFGFVIPTEKRISQHLYVDFRDSLKAQAGEVVVAEIIEYPSHHRNPEAKIIEVLGRRDSKGVDTELLIRKHDLSTEFPRKVLEATEKLGRAIPEKEIKKRIDLRELPMITIDPSDAKDFDDAISIEMTEKGNYLLGVHIADVSHYVKPGKPIDEEAYERATSIYLEDRVLPMLPERLSNNLCSLREKEERLAVSVKMEIGPRGNVRRHEIFDSIIRVNHRMAYDEAFAVLEGERSLTEKYSDFAENLKTMNRLARILRAKRSAKGSLDFNLPEAKAIFDDDGQVVDIILQRQTMANELVEEFMLLANETVARHITAHNIPMIYRIHEEPNAEKIEAFRQFVASLGYLLSERESRTPRGLQKISRMVQGQPDEMLINYLLLRSLKEARYSSENAGHFGLACDCYTHFTSPIRRYPDLVVHRIVKSLSAGGPDSARGTVPPNLENVAEHCSLREREAVDVERESLEIKQLLFMSGKLSDEFAGRITGVQSFGLFVELEDYLIEGMIRVSDLDDDYYIFMEEKHCLAGENTGKTYRLGDKVRVQVVRVDVEKRQMDFILVDDHAASEATRKGKQRKTQRRKTAAASGRPRKKRSSTKKSGRKQRK